MTINVKKTLIVGMGIEPSMSAVVRHKADIAQPGNCVQLSPAVASFDMVENFKPRELVFAVEVRKLCA